MKMETTTRRYISKYRIGGGIGYVHLLGRSAIKSVSHFLGTVLRKNKKAKQGG